MYHSFLIHSSAVGPLGCFHVLAVINSAAMNIGVHVSLSDLVPQFVWKYKKPRIAKTILRKKAILPFTVTWMDLEDIIQSDVSQKEEHQYSMLTHIYGISEDGNDNPICKTEKETQMYRTDFCTLWEKVRVG